ncbi:DNA-binding domain-containing protein [Chromobacterium subtsugae]|uniref:HvfC/BufC N-terminal domain-containing protein n=1 Tax=Chromobacterium subtsugae TaxID=251747 RepID=UPI000641871C|nr:DNA-binding domain-containing protein [Chromobacterium subtsugae]
MSRPALLDSQMWLLTAMTAGGALEQGLALARSRCGLGEDLVAEPPRGKRRDRIGVYQHGYWARLLECLRADYPMLLVLLGQPLFDLLARGYIASRPSRSPSLHDLGADFADFLAASQPDPDAAECRLPVELARLERAHAEIGRAEGVEGASPPPFNDWLVLLGAESPLAGMVLPDSVRLLKTSLPLLACWHELQRGQRLAVPALAEGRLALARRQWRVSAHELEPWQFELLQAMARLGGGEKALSEAAEQAGVEAAWLRARAAAWLPTAQDLGLVRRREAV